MLLQVLQVLQRGALVQLLLALLYLLLFEHVSLLFFCVPNLLDRVIVSVQERLLVDLFCL